MSEDKRGADGSVLSTQEEGKSIRKEAPMRLREVVIEYANKAGLPPEHLKDLITEVLGKEIEQQEGVVYFNTNVESLRLLNEAEWYEVYDIIEKIEQTLSNCVELLDDDNFDDAEVNQIFEAGHIFTTRLNRFFSDNGIAWKLVFCQLMVRHSENIEESFQRALKLLESSHYFKAEEEFYIALEALAKRPEEDISGAMRHAVNALSMILAQFGGEGSATFNEETRELKFIMSHDEVIAMLESAVSKGDSSKKDSKQTAFEKTVLMLKVCADMMIYILSEE